MPFQAEHILWIVRLALVGGLAVLSACSPSTHTDDVLLSGDAPVPKDAKYPDFAKPLSSAMDQMSNEDAKKMEAQLSGLAARRHSGAISEAEYLRRVNEMRKLRADMEQSLPANSPKTN